MSICNASHQPTSPYSNLVAQGGYDSKRPKERVQSHIKSSLLLNSEWLQSSDGSAQDQRMNVMSSCKEQWKIKDVYTETLKLS